MIRLAEVRSFEACLEFLSKPEVKAAAEVSVTLKFPGTYNWNTVSHNELIKALKSSNIVEFACYDQNAAERLLFEKGFVRFLWRKPIRRLVMRLHEMDDEVEKRFVDNVVKMSHLQSLSIFQYHSERRGVTKELVKQAALSSLSSLEVGPMGSSKENIPFSFVFHSWNLRSLFINGNLSIKNQRVFLSYMLRNKNLQKVSQLCRWRPSAFFSLEGDLNELPIDEIFLHCANEALIFLPLPLFIRINRLYGDYGADCVRSKRASLKVLYQKYISSGNHDQLSLKLRVGEDNKLIIFSSNKDIEDAWNDLVLIP